MNGTELLATAATLSLPALLDLIGIAAFGAVMVAAACEWTARANKRVFLDKYAQQSAAMALLLIIVSILGSIPAMFLLMDRFPGLMQWFSNPSMPLVHTLAAAGATTLLLAVWSITWKKLRKKKGLHAGIGLLAGIGALATMGIGTAAAALVLPALKTGIFPQWPAALPMHVWALIGQYFFTALGAGAGLSLVYLVLRRNKDDFGRDYYRFSLSAAAKWALAPMLIQLGFQGWLFSTLSEQTRQAVQTGPLGILWLVTAGCALICVGLWLAIARSQTPVRLKWAAFLGSLLLWIMHTANTLLFLNLSGIA